MNCTCTRWVRHSALQPVNKAAHDHSTSSQPQEKQASHTAVDDGCGTPGRGDATVPGQKAAGAEQEMMSLTA